MQTVSLRGAASRRPTLRAEVRAHPDGGKLARFSLTLPKALVVNRAKARRQSSAVRVKGRTVTVTVRPKKGAARITLRLGKGALRLEPKVRNKLP